MMRLFLLVEVAGVASTVPGASALSPEAWTTVRRGGVHVEAGFVPAELVRALREDAAALHAAGAFRADGLFRTTAARDDQGFRAEADRQTMRRPWTEAGLGDVDTRLAFRGRMLAVRAEAAAQLARPDLGGEGGQDEMTYNWYEPGAALRLHLDEHHEELKGVRGYVSPTRRSVTWLVYLNDDWADADGGTLRCFTRAPACTTPRAGASQAGDVQVGWLGDGRTERPVFLGLENDDPVLFCEDEGVDGKLTSKVVLSPPGSMGDAPLVGADLARFVVVPSSLTTTSRRQLRFDQLSSPCLDGATARRRDDEKICDTTTLLHKERQRPLDITPRAGTLVIFDSVAVPHEVLTVQHRPRIAATGWFHATLPEVLLPENLALPDVEPSS